MVPRHDAHKCQEIVMTYDDHDEDIVVIHHRPKSVWVVCEVLAMLWCVVAIENTTAQAFVLSLLVALLNVTLANFAFNDSKIVALLMKSFSQHSCLCM